MKTGRLGLELGSGSARGFAHIGVLKALEQSADHGRRRRHVPTEGAPCTTLC
jgi:hypothetical protein